MTPIAGAKTKRVTGHVLACRPLGGTTRYALRSVAWKWIDAEHLSKLDAMHPPSAKLLIPKEKRLFFAKISARRKMPHLGLV